MEKHLYETLSSVLPPPLTFPSEMQQAIDSTLIHQTIKKNEVILKAGEVSEKIYFIEKGLLRAYYLINGEEVSAWFKRENEFIVSIGSFYTGKPSYEYIEAIEDSEVWYISKSQMDEYCARSIEFALVALLHTRPVLIEWDELLYCTRKQNSKARFDLFMKTKSDLLHRVPDKFLASYLGMTPETFSKVKTKYFKASTHLATVAEQSKKIA
jgi:CRP/FNR family transcriptional regulator, anaerobic regulatory protein